MAARAKRLRTNATAHRISRYEKYVPNCSELDAIVAAASEVTWLHNEPGRIIVADNCGRFICKVWNAESFDPNRFDGPRIESPTIHRVGHFVIESVRPLKTEVRSHYLTVEAPE